MLRTFQPHRIRPIESLDGWWDFTLADDGPEPPERHPERGDYNRTIHTPAVWENTPGLESYRGQAWFRRAIPVKEGRACRVVFEGVSHTATAFINGEAVGHHEDAYTPWVAMGTPDAGEGMAELTVYVDNTFGDHAALHKENDYYAYGGITRPAEVQYVPPVYIERVAATPRREGGRWNLDVSVELHNWSEGPLRRRVHMAVADGELPFGEKDVPAGERVVLTGTLRGLGVEPWSPLSPNLYWLTTTLHDAAAEDDGEHHEPVDDLIERIGFREVKVEGKQIFLNGEAIRLRGFNRHEDHGCFGCALPLEAMVRDLDLIRDMGGDFVRTCHYPNDRRFLDLCDELGFYVWEESHYRQARIDHPKFYEQVTASTEEMMRWHHNHPSIIIWGCLNELPSDTPEGRDAVEHVTNILKRDDSRPCTFASHKNTKDLALGLVDIVSWNRYDAWYSSGKLDNIEPELKSVLKWLHSCASHGGAGKPVIMSEFGAGAIPGYYMPHHAKWTEQYQSEALDESLRVYLNEPDVVGVAIWQFCDIRVTQGMAIARPRTMNNKGIVDEYRRPKLAYDAVRRRMRGSDGNASTNRADF